MVIPTTSRSACPGVRAAEVVVEARILPAPRRRVRPLTLPAATIFAIEGLAAHRELVLPIRLGELSEGALPGVARLTITVHGRRRRTKRSGRGRRGGVRSGSRTALDVRKGGWKP
jgi:hypothetical protein